MADPALLVRRGRDAAAMSGAAHRRDPHARRHGDRPGAPRRRLAALRRPGPDAVSRIPRAGASGAGRDPPRFQPGGRNSPLVVPSGRLAGRAARRGGGSGRNARFHDALYARPSRRPSAEHLCARILPRHRGLRLSALFTPRRTPLVGKAGEEHGRGRPHDHRRVGRRGGAPRPRSRA